MASSSERPRAVGGVTSFTSTTHKKTDSLRCPAPAQELKRGESKVHSHPDETLLIVHGLTLLYPYHK
jgi:hypothetical protein